MYSGPPTSPPLPFGMSRPASDFLDTKDDPPFLSAPASQRLSLLRKLSWQESSPRSTPSPFSLAPSSVPPFCSPMPLPTSMMLSETTLQLAQTRSELAESKAANKLLARALAERMARERQFEELARAAAQERDDIAERCAGRVMRVEQDRDEAARERDDLRLALSHLNLVDSSSGSSMSMSTDSDEATTSDVTTILRTVSKELQLENARSQAHARSDSLDSLKSDKSLPSYTESDSSSTRTAVKPPVPALLTPKLTPILNTSDSDTTVCARSKTGSQDDVSLATANERRKMLDALPLPSNLPLKEPPPMILPARYTFTDVFGHSLGNRSTQVALSGYHVLSEPLTIWPSEDHTHGFFFAPTIRCFSLSVAGTFAWREIDAVGTFAKPTECFYRVKECNYHYAGIYRGTRIADVSPEEYMAFSPEMKEALVDLTLRDRRVVAPQLRLDLKQLYELGALKIACVALQCTGYNKRLCDAVYRHVDKCRRSGHWKGIPFD